MDKAKRQGKSREQIVLEGLEYEEVEKKKASERRALTRKNGLKREDALWADTTPGQTRDIVGKKLNICGKHWDRMKYIYSHKNECSKQEYKDWDNGLISTSKLYSKLKNNTAILKEIEFLIDALTVFESDLLRYMENLEIQIKSELTMHAYLEKQIVPLLDEFKKQFPIIDHSTYALLSRHTKIMRLNQLEDILFQINKIKRKVIEN